MALGAFLRHLRLAKGLTLEDLSDLSGVEVGTISALENRDSERSKFAPLLAKALGVSLEQFLAGGNTAGRPLDPPGESLSVVHAHAPHSKYDAWPLPGVTRRQFFDELTTADRAEIVGFVKGLLRNSAQRTHKRSTTQSSDLVGTGTHLPLHQPPAGPL